MSDTTQPVTTNSNPPSFAWTFAQSVLGSLVRSAITLGMGWLAIRWPIFDKLLAPVANDPVAIAGIVAGVTAFLMAIVSTLLKRLHTNKAIADALDAAAAAVERTDAKGCTP
jgi:hypothetical protein